MDRLFIVVPAYNESANIRQFVSDWYPIVEKNNAAGSSRLVVVNDGSRDDTWDILQDLAKTRPLLQPLTKPNGGHGPAILFGYRYALSEGADYVFQTDSDGQTDPHEFDSFWNQRASYDALFGWRKRRGDGRNRAFVERTLCLLLRLIFHVSIPDANAPFRLMTSAYLEEFLPKMPEDYELPNVMLTTFGAYYHKKIKFVPISFGARQGGKNSINARKIVRTGVRAVRAFWGFRLEMQKS